MCCAASEEEADNLNFIPPFCGFTWNLAAREKSDPEKFKCSLHYVKNLIFFFPVLLQCS